MISRAKGSRIETDCREYILRNVVEKRGEENDIKPLSFHFWDL